MHLFDLVVELRPLEHLEGVAVDVKHFVGLNFSVTALNNRFFSHIYIAFAQLFLIKSIDLPLPLFLDDFDDIALVLRLENWQRDLDRPIFDLNMGRVCRSLAELGGIGSCQTLLVVYMNGGRDVAGSIVRVENCARFERLICVVH